LVASFTDYLKKKGSFFWTKAADEAFTLIKDKLSNAPILAFSDLEKVFELECDACGVGLELFTRKEANCFLSQKLNEARQKWSTYEQELYAVYHSLKTWESYLIAYDFVLYSDHHSLQHFKNQKHIKASYFEQFNFVIHHKFRVDNKVSDALSRSVQLLVTLQG